MLHTKFIRAVVLLSYESRVCSKSGCFVYKPDTPPAEQQKLFLQKIDQCSTVFDFMDPVSELKGKEIKRACLNELVDFITSGRGVLTEPVYPEIIKLVSGEIRSLHLCSSPVVVWLVLVVRTLILYTQDSWLLHNGHALWRTILAEQEIYNFAQRLQ